MRMPSQNLSRKAKSPDLSSNSHLALDTETPTLHFSQVTLQAYFTPDLSEYILQFKSLTSEYEHVSEAKPSYLKGFFWVPAHTDARGAKSESRAFISIQVPHPVEIKMSIQMHIQLYDLVCFE